LFASIEIHAKNIGFSADDQKIFKYGGGLYCLRHPTKCLSATLVYVLANVFNTFFCVSVLLNFAGNYVMGTKGLTIN
jgi:hypothetical protein